jgi:3-hydroxyacyl-[acyl-carrier-protein] dehydratase
MKNLLILDEDKLVGDEFWARKTIPTEAIFFEGHYPDNPILPGVLQLELATIAAEKLMRETGKGRLNLVKVLKYRFFRSVLPGEPVTIRVRLKERGELGWVVLADLSVANEPASSGILVMGERLSAGLRGEILPEPEAEPANAGSCMGIAEIIQILPHRFPFLQLDRVIKIEGMTRITGIKNITASDYVLWGRDILAPFPQSLLIEAVSQCAGILGLQLMSKSGVALFGSITNATFSGETFPGDQLILEATVIRAFSDGCIVSGRIRVNNRLICEVENMVSAVR